MDEYVPGSMTDEQALETLKSMKLTMGRGSAKTMFQQGLLEAICHAIVALEETVENKGEWIATNETDEFYGKVYKCSRCGHEVLGCGCRNFCTWCKADMRGNKKE